MQATSNSDPKPVEVRNGDVFAERIREWLPEESLLVQSRQVGQVGGSHVANNRKSGHCHLLTMECDTSYVRLWIVTIGVAPRV
jgi:hypothetical protein